MGFDDSRVRMTTEVESLLLRGLEARGRGFADLQMEDWLRSEDVKAGRQEKRFDVVQRRGIGGEATRQD